jgi:N-acetylglutamate synthase-like GNAT family acetyltransferase
MASEIKVRRARLLDAEAIAAFVSSAQGAAPRERSRITRRTVAERFGQVGFMIAEVDGEMLGLLGWQVENLVVRVTDFLLSGTESTVLVGSALIDRMEAEGQDLQAEAVILFLPVNPSPKLVTFWEQFGYEFQGVEQLQKAWREAVTERDRTTRGVMVKRLREDYIRRPF